MAQLRVHTVPWSHCPNRNVFSDRLNWPYDSPDCPRSSGRLLHTLVSAAAKVLSPSATFPKELRQGAHFLS